jgi:hypothetical protein
MQRFSYLSEWDTSYVGLELGLNNKASSYSLAPSAHFLSGTTFGKVRLVYGLSAYADRNADPTVYGNESGALSLLPVLGFSHRGRRANFTALVRPSGYMKTWGDFARSHYYYPTGIVALSYKRHRFLAEYLVDPNRSYVPYSGGNSISPFIRYPDEIVYANTTLVAARFVYSYVIFIRPKTYFQTDFSTGVLVGLSTNSIESLYLTFGAQLRHRGLTVGAALSTLGIKEPHLFFSAHSNMSFGKFSFGLFCRSFYSSSPLLSTRNLSLGVSLSTSF